MIESMAEEEKRAQGSRAERADPLHDVAGVQGAGPRVRSEGGQRAGRVCHRSSKLAGIDYAIMFDSAEITFSTGSGYEEESRRYGSKGVSDPQPLVRVGTPR
jgi:hypothetical protein